MRAKVICVAVCLTLLFGFAGLSRAAEKAPIKVGALYALSGPFGVLGVDLGKTVQLAADHINRDGGILGRKVEVILRDDETSPATAERVARKMVLEDKVNFITGGNGSPAGMSLSQVANRFKTIYLSSGGAMVEGMTGKDCNRYTFRINNPGLQFYKSEAEYVAKNFPNVKTVAGINPDYSYGHEMVEGFFGNLKKLRPDINVVTEAWVPMTAQDYTNYISAVMEKKPDLVYSVFWSGAGVAFVRQAKPYGLFEKSKFFLAAAAISTSMVTLGKDMVTMWGSEPYVPSLNEPMNKRFVADFMKQNNKPPHAFCAHAYASLMVMKQAMEKAKTTDTEKVVGALEDGNFDTPWGKTLVRKCDHQAMTKVFIGEAKPDPKSPWWALSDIKVISAEQVLPACADTGCKLR